MLTVIVTSIASVAGAVLAAFIWETKLRDRITLIRIGPDHPEAVEELLELYEHLFLKDPANYSLEELNEFLVSSKEHLAAPNRHVRVENIALGARQNGRVVGFVLCHFYPDRRKAIVSYLGIDRSSLKARRDCAARRKLFAGLRRALTSRRRDCQYLFYDLVGVDPSTPKVERRERQARPTLFIQAAEALGLIATEICLDYRPARVSLDDDEPDYPLRLWCIPLKGSLPAVIPKALVLEFLEFIYMDCYGDFYSTDDPRFAEHQQYLRQIVDHYAEALPDFTAVKCGRPGRHSRRAPRQ